jgi:hypothetical protein
LRDELKPDLYDIALSSDEKDLSQYLS